MSLKKIAVVAIAVLALLAAGCTSNPVGSSDQYEYSSTEEFTYSVGDSVLIVADTFVGAVTFDQTVERSVRARVIRWADRQDDLELLEVEASQVAPQIRVSATNPQDLDDVAVDIEISGPPEVLLDLATGVGAVVCSGEPGAVWEADSGVGSVELAVPADVNISVELIAGVGAVDVDFEVDGEVSAQRVVGTIGTGDEGEVVAHVGVGRLSLSRR